MPFQFEWEPEKAIANFAKHGVSFREATEVFGDPLSTTTDDFTHSDEELRYWTIGVSRKGRLLVVSHTDRGDKMRIIGARRATRREQQVHEEDPT